VLLVAGIVAAGARDRLVLSEAPKSVLYRLQYWESTSAMIADHPWLGCGPGNFQQTYTRYKLPQASESISDPHNFVLEIWSTGGTPAVLVLLVIVVWLAYRVLRGERSCRADNAAQDAQTNPTASETIWIFGGAAVGVPLGFVAAAAVGYPPDLAVLWIGLPVGAAAVWGLHAWTAAAAGPFAGNGEAARHADGDTAQQIGAAEGALPIWVLGSALLALTINLLAAGGFSFTGVAICWWILAALILNHSDGGRRVHLTPTRAAVVAISAGLLAGACYWTMYRPVLGCHAALSDAAAARGKGLLQQAESACQRAAEIDPYSAEPWVNLAALYADLIEVTGDRDWLGDFDRAVQQAIRRRGGAANVFRRIGDWRLSLYSRLNDPLQLQHAREAYSRWVELYPSDSLAHAQLAWGRHLADDTQGAARSAEQALRLDQMHPHRERKLVNQSVFDPTGTLPAALDAEQLMKRLRR
jgi:tetratricopeptide (TPR) repeat protein